MQADKDVILQISSHLQLFVASTIFSLSVPAELSWTELSWTAVSLSLHQISGAHEF